MLATGGAGEDEPKSLTDREGSPLFALPNDPSRATLLNKLREPERKQEDEDNLVEFMKNQGKDTPQNKKEFGKWMSRVAEPIAVLVMVHDEKHVQIVSNAMQYAASRRADKGQSMKRQNAWRVGGQE